MQNGNRGAGGGGLHTASDPDLDLQKTRDPGCGDRYAELAGGALPCPPPSVYSKRATRRWAQERRTHKREGTGLRYDSGERVISLTEWISTLTSYARNSSK